MNSSKIFRFQQRYVFFELPVFWLIFTIMVLSILPSIISYLTSETIMYQALRAALYLNLTAFAIFMLYRLIKRDLRQTEFRIDDTTITVKRNSRQTSLNCAEITDIRFIRLPFIRGFIQLETPSQMLALPLYLEDLQGFIVSFQSMLKATGTLQLLSQQTQNQLTTESLVYSNAYMRSLKAFKPVLALSVTFCMTNAIIAEKIWGLGLIAELICALTGLLLPIAAYFFADIYVNTTLRKRYTNTSTNVDESLASAYILPGLLVLFLYFLCGITIRILLP